ncbi:hypothetical protein BDR26DRAFT_962594 [Obelidium mucronatum]|nr:hypothetical protein BDR26DRAFT_962594 [Obelidium mucronatum]
MPINVKHTVASTTTKTFTDGHKETSTSSTVFTVSVKSLLDKYVDFCFFENPTSCIMFGVRKYEDRRVFSLSKEDAVDARNRLLELQAEVKAFVQEAGKALSAEESADIAFLQEAIDMDLTSRGVPGEKGYALELSENHMSSSFVFLEMIFQHYQRDETAEDLQNYKKRLELKLAGNAGPAFASVEEATEFAAKSELNKSAKAKELLGDEHYFVPVIRDEYSTAIFQNTTVRYTAEEVHQIGLAEVSRIHALMEETKTKIGFEGTVEEFQAALQDKEKYPSLYYENPDDVQADYVKICEDAKAKMVDYFEQFPKFDSIREEQSPLAMYQPGTPEKAGRFVYNRLLHKTKPSHQKTALCLHEANPGHHHQVSLAFENTKLHLAKRMAFYTAYAEGWGLYCEYLGEEMGFYSDPFQYFGRLELEMWRAVRLVVDSALHAKGWSIEESVQYMLSKVSMSRAEA